MFLRREKPVPKKKSVLKAYIGADVTAPPNAHEPPPK